MSELAQHSYARATNTDTMPKTAITKKSVTWTLDIEVVEALYLYIESIKKTLPESMRGSTKLQSSAANDILLKFLKEKGFYKEKQPEPAQVPK